MYSHEKKRRFIQLRGQGLSYRKIAKELKISTPTLVKWSLILDIHINNAKVMEFESMKEEYHATSMHRAKVLATQLNNVAQALVESDCSKIPPYKLMEMQTRLENEFQEQLPKIEFHRKIPFGGSEAIKKIMEHTDTWPV